MFGWHTGWLASQAGSRQESETSKQADRQAGRQTGNKQARTEDVGEKSGKERESCTCISDDNYGGYNHANNRDEAT